MMHLSRAVLDQVNIVVITSTPVIQYSNSHVRVESDPGLIFFCFSLLCDLSRKLALLY